LIHNRWFDEARVDAVYMPLRVKSGEGVASRFFDGCLARPWLDLGGLSVTIPHKAAVLEWLGDRADRTSQSIGAANTIVFRNDGVSGFNTDVQAATASLCAALNRRPAELAGLTVDVLGTGGAARAVLSGLRDFGASVTVYGRSPERTRSIAHQFHAAPASWSERSTRTGEVVINCAGVGMWPDVDGAPLNVEQLTGSRLVFDLIYNPLETALLRNARSAGIATLNGLDMFVRQAAMQFELWTGKAPSTEQAMVLLEESLSSPGT
jgi:3-dehydroquinate dehydratase/shikimate dehydrogenase